MFPCPFCKYKANHKVNLQKHVKSSHEKDKSQGLKMELYSDNDDVEMEEYFETNVKSEADSDIIEFDRMKEVKQKFQYGNAKEEMEEYFERDVKFAVESVVEPNYYSPNYF